jgi:transposase
MANKSTTMLKLKRVIQLRLNGESKSEISRIIPIHRNILNKYLLQFDNCGKSYTDLLFLTETELHQIAIPPKASNENERLSHFQNLIPDFISELSKTGVTLKLLWVEYIEQTPNGYSYAQFCTHFTDYKKRLSATMHFEHIAGEKLEIDFAGSKLSYVDVQTGEIIYCPVLVCSLPYSGYTYVEALENASQENMFLAMNRCLEFMGGVARNVKSDNMRQFITKNSRYEFTFTELADQWALHYNTSLAAARPRKPKDKPTVENNVYQSYLRVFAPMRKMEFHSLEALNESILIHVDKHNSATFQKKPGSRKERFMLYEKAELITLPNEPFVIKHTVKSKVQRNYHITLGEDSHQYSVPFNYIGKTTTLVYDQFEVEVFIDMKRIALHKRDRRGYGYTTVREHMPPHHQKQTDSQGWDAEHFKRYAQSVGANCAKFISILMANSTFVEQTYKACMGVKSLERSYGLIRLEAACGRALLGKISYFSLKLILEKNLEKQPFDHLDEHFPEILHENIRGSKEYF